MKSINVESAPRGKVVIATKNYLPGELILEEKPLMVVPKEYIDSFEKFDVPYDVMCNWANYTWFQSKLTTERQAKVLALFELTTCKEADRLRRMADRIVLYEPNGDQRSLTLSEIDMLVKLTRIMKRDTFPMRGDQILYSEMTNFAHSCDANCHFVIDLGQTDIRCSAIRPIASGEELTISYLPLHDMEFTHQRRRAYLDTYEFTCHCPRYDAPGDDMRKFNCPDPSCTGVMMVCQPINTDKIHLAGLQYTGVEYVEPHLLPCTVCHRAIPAAEQPGILGLEDHIPNAVRVLAETERELTDPRDCKVLLKEIQEITHAVLPHSLYLPMHLVRLKLERFLYMHGVANGADTAQLTVHRARVQQAAFDYITGQEQLFKGPHRVEVLWSVCLECVFFVHYLLRLKHMPPIFPPAEVKELLQKALRMQLMFLGRETGRNYGMCEDLHKYLLKALQQLPVPSAVRYMQVCAFCEESPVHASMKRSRCGACKKVLYCSAGCQKAHWKLHKKTCKAGPVVA